MLTILHRRNTVSKLLSTPPEYGVEIDIRSYENRLIVQHEPFVDAIEFEKWVIHYHHNTLILNVKEAGIEYRVREIVHKNNIDNYFFLDLSFPALVKMANEGEKRIAVRFSEYESVEMALNLAGKVNWVWVDCFSKMPLNKTTYDALSKHFKLCVVSPELLGRSSKEIRKYKKLLSPFRIDAVCTKRADLWV